MCLMQEPCNNWNKASGYSMLNYTRDWKGILLPVLPHPILCTAKGVGRVYSCLAQDQSLGFRRFGARSISCKIEPVRT